MKYCSEFLLSHLKPSNAVEIYELLNKFSNCRRLVLDSIRYILQNFRAVAKSDIGFQNCSGQFLENILADDMLNASEEHIFEILRNWMKFGDRFEKCGYLFKHIRWTLLDSQYFADQVEYYRGSGVKGMDLKENKYVDQARRYFIRNYNTRNISSDKIENSLPKDKQRIPTEIVFSMGGWSERLNGPTSSIEIFDHRENKWELSKINLPSPRAYSGTCVVEGCIYIL